MCFGNVIFAAARRAARNFPPGSANGCTLRKPSASTATPKVGNCTVVLF
jgi:hypothetical protein